MKKYIVTCASLVTLIERTYVTVAKDEREAKDKVKNRFIEDIAGINKETIHTIHIKHIS